MNDELYPDDVTDYIQQGLPVLETSARVDSLPSHERFGLAVATKGDEFTLVESEGEGRAWEIPGGKVKIGESFEEAARREFREETGHNIENPRPIAVVVETYYSRNSERVVDGVVFTGQRGDEVREPEDKTASVGRFNELPDNLTQITFTRETFEELTSLACDDVE